MLTASDLTSVRTSPISRAVTRIFLALLIALSLIGAPPPAQAASSPSCPMPEAGNGMAVDHADMACCTIKCPAPSSPAALERGPVELLEAALFPSPLATGPTTALSSVDLAATDPPPRLHHT